MVWQQRVVPKQLGYEEQPHPWQFVFFVEVRVAVVEGNLTVDERGLEGSQRQTRRKKYQLEAGR